MKQFQIYLPPPKDWQDFQSLMKDIAASRYNPASVVEYGRQGQRQDGVDIYAEDFFGNRIGIQCKESKDEIKESEAVAESEKARKFKGGLNLFIIASTTPTDAKLQSAVIALNAKKDWPFTIRVEFWNDFVRDINKYAMVLNDCYQSYREAFQRDDESNHLACLRVAFDRPAFKDDFRNERSCNDFEEALVTTKRLFRTGFTKDRWSQIPVVQTIPIDFLPHGKYRDWILKIEKQLERIYKDYIADKARIRTDQTFADNRSGHYNIVRGDLMRELNRKLIQKGLTEISFGYA